MVHFVLGDSTEYIKKVKGKKTNIITLLYLTSQYMWIHLMTNMVKFAIFVFAAFSVVYSVKD